MSLGMIIDVIAILIIIVAAVIGVIKGFTKTFVSIFGAFLSLLFAVLLCASVARFLESSFGTISKVSDWLKGVLTGIFGEEIMNTTLEQANEASISGHTLSNWLVRIVLQVKNDGTLPPDSTIGTVICPVFAYYIVAIFAVVLLYVIFRIIFFLIAESVKDLRKIKIVKTTDSLLGLVMGIVYGIIIINLSVMIISIIPLGFCQEIIVGIDNSVFTKFLNNINIFGIILNSLSDPSAIVGSILA